MGVAHAELLVEHDEWALGDAQQPAQAGIPPVEPRNIDARNIDGVAVCHDILADLMRLGSGQCSHRVFLAWCWISQCESPATLGSATPTAGCHLRLRRPRRFEHEATKCRRHEPAPAYGELKDLHMEGPKQVSLHLSTSQIHVEGPCRFLHSTMSAAALRSSRVPTPLQLRCIEDPPAGAAHPCPRCFTIIK